MVQSKEQFVMLVNRYCVNYKENNKLEKRDLALRDLKDEKDKIEKFLTLQKLSSNSKVSTYGRFLSYKVV